MREVISLLKPIQTLNQLLAVLRMIAAISAFLFILPITASADFMILIQGIPNTANFSITTSGSHVITSTVAAQETAFIRVPRSTGWANPFESNFGDILVGTPRLLDLIATSGSNDLSISGSVSYFRQHTGLRTLESFPDRFALTTASSLLPTLGAGDVVNFSGTTPFTLPGGLTFDSFWNEGVYNVLPAPDLGSYTVMIRSVPEPSVIALLSLGGVGLYFRRHALSRTGRQNLILAFSRFTIGTRQPFTVSVYRRLTA